MEQQYLSATGASDEIWKCCVPCNRHAVCSSGSCRTECCGHKILCISSSGSYRSLPGT